MGSKTKPNGAKCRAHFEAVQKKLGICDQAIFERARLKFSMAPGSAPGAKPVSDEAAVNDFGRFRLAKAAGRFDCPPYVQAFLEDELRPAKPATKKTKRPDTHRRNGRRGSHSGLHC